jgi:hypothetical protein
LDVVVGVGVDVVGVLWGLVVEVVLVIVEDSVFLL